MKRKTTFIYVIVSFLVITGLNVSLFDVIVNGMGVGNKGEASKDKKLHCDFPGCDYETVRRGNLRAHKRRHTGDLLKCDNEGCDYETVQCGNLTAHKRKHTGDLFKCDHEGCDFEAAFSGNLTEHKRKHTGDLFKCDHEGCNYETARRGHLIEHQRKHTGDLFKCDYEGCDYENIGVDFYQNTRGSIRVIYTGAITKVVIMRQLIMGI